MKTRKISLWFYNIIKLINNIQIRIYIFLMQLIAKSMAQKNYIINCLNKNQNQAFVYLFFIRSRKFFSPRFDMTLRVTVIFPQSLYLDATKAALRPENFRQYLISKLSKRRGWTCGGSSNNYALCTFVKTTAPRHNQDSERNRPNGSARRRNSTWPLEIQLC